MADTPLGRYVPLFKKRGQGSADLLSSTHTLVLLLRSINRWVASCVVIAEAASLRFGEWPAHHGRDREEQERRRSWVLAIFCVEK